jgi:hypothetical protein
MSIPKQVQKQSEEVQELYKQLNAVAEGEQVQEQTPVTETPESPVNEVVNADSNSVEEKAPKSEAEEQGTADTQGKETWEQKYKTLQGMYNKDVPRLNASNREMQNRVAQLEQLLSTMNNQPKPEAAPVSNDPLITDDDIKEYGDSIDVMRRAAREEVNTANGRIAQLEAMIQKMQGVVPQVQQMQSAQKASNEQAFWNSLSSAVPNWEEINDNQEFQTWLLQMDPLSGITRQTYLDDAQRNLDVQRVVNFFKSWERENGVTVDAQDKRPTANSQLERQVSPGRGRSSGKPSIQEGQKYSPTDISAFFDAVRKGKYKGREEERGRIERDIFAAQREGRIVTA